MNTIPTDERKKTIVQARRMLNELESKLGFGQINLLGYKQGLVEVINLLEDLDERLIEIPTDTIKIGKYSNEKI